MEDVFRGKKDVKIDAKGRLSFPAPFRRALEANHPDRPVGENATVFIAHYDQQPYLTCFTVRGMEELTRKIEQMHPGSDDREALEEFLYENIVDLTLDDNGRMVLPKDLRDSIGLTDTAIFGGRRDTFRIYSPDVPKVAISKLARQMAHLPADSSPLKLLPGAEALS